ncbi:hypothetical protein ACFXD5_23860, partial [Streptomyces sp. NPDC059385]
LFKVEAFDDEDVETVGGLLAKALGRVPIAGATATGERPAGGPPRGAAPPGPAAGPPTTAAVAGAVTAVGSPGLPVQ